MLKELKNLFLWLNKNKLNKMAQQVKHLIPEEDWDEPWHEEAVKEFGDSIEEEEVDLDKFTANQGELGSETTHEIYKRLYQKIMNIEGFKPLISGKGNFLGEGVSGIVFDGIYDGHQAAIKIILSKSNKIASDIKIWEKILSLKNIIPGELRKHLPEIYKLNSGEIDGMNYSIIIMENLDELPKSMQSQILGFYEENNYRLKDEDFLYQLAINIAEVLRLNIDEIFKILISTDLNLNIEKEKILSLIKPYDDDYVEQTYSNEFYSRKEKIKGNLFRKFSELLKMHGKEPEDYFTELDQVNLLLDDAIRTSEFPRHYMHYNPKENLSLSYNPETKNLIKLLNILKENGLGWGDLHFENLMLGRDGNIKIVDVGLFKILE